MAEIKPSEVTAILRQQLSNTNLETSLEEVGTVLTAGDGIARVYGLGNVQAGELVEFENGVQAIVQNLEEDNVGVVILGNADSISEGDIVKRTKRIASIRVGEGLLGRVINTIGEPIDGKGKIEGELFEMPLERKAPGVIYRQPRRTVADRFEGGRFDDTDRTRTERVDNRRQTDRKDSYRNRHHTQSKRILRQRKAGLLYLCSLRTERFDCCKHSKDPRRKGSNEIYGRFGSNSFRFGSHAVLCTICRSGNRRVFQRYGTSSLGCV